MYQSEIKAFEDFIKPLSHLINISNEDDLENAHDFISELIDACGDKENAPLNPLINIIASAIERYEEKDADLMSFIDKASGIPTHIATLNVLMDQYNLTSSDLPEIGNKTMVRRVLNDISPLTKPAIEKLCIRFKIRPDLLFDIPK
ncbi:MAG: hypothetical protein RPR97_13490 [Colwellia sp.]